MASVGDGMVSVINKANETEDIPFGACVWATGIAMNPLVRTMQPLLPGQNHFRCKGGRWIGGRGEARVRVGHWHWMNPLVRTMQPLLPGQNHFRCGGAGGQANYCHMPLFFLSPCACSILTLHITLPLFLLAGLS